jgi:serine/threonine protein kinase
VVGKTLGPYKIIEPLGAGGMGEVYLGEDTRLGRKVAIKVLPEEYAADPERLARFEQEARAAAALNHPHIAVVHDVGSETGEEGADTHFMVQEYLEGEPLRQPLMKGALPIKKALELATEIAEAISAAHTAGIVHRDLKPDNIFVTKEGHAKILDFGLAKLVEMAPAMSPGMGASKSPTMLGTVAGQVMGTAGYMAPEQVQGTGEIDRRADVFAFGSVLYEMVTGR